MGTKRNDGNQIEAVNKTIRVLELLKEFDGARVSELADRLGWPKSTVHSHLATLERNEYITREGDLYVVGLKFLDFGEYVKTRKDVYSLIEPKIHDLAEKTGERVQFVVSEHSEAVYVRIATGDHAVSTGSRLGRRRSMLHATAAGKAILAFLPESEVWDVIDRKGLPKLTQNTITDEAVLFESLEEVRERGYAFNHEEHIDGLQAVAAPVVTPTDEVVGSISIAGPTHRMRGPSFTEEIPDMILGARNEIELDIAYR